LSPEEAKSSVKRNKNGTLMKGSVINPYGPINVNAWTSLRKKIGNDLDFLYKEAIRLIQFADKDSVKAGILLGLLNMLKPKVEPEHLSNVSSLSHATMQHLYETIVKQEEEIRKLRNKNSSSSSQENNDK